MDEVVLESLIDRLKSGLITKHERLTLARHVLGPLIENPDRCCDDELDELEAIATDIDNALDSAG